MSLIETTEVPGLDTEGTLELGTVNHQAEGH